MLFIVILVPNTPCAQSTEPLNVTVGVHMWWHLRSVSRKPQRLLVSGCSETTFLKLLKYYNKQPVTVFEWRDILRGSHRRAYCTACDAAAEHR